ncbi:MAG: hypothetical protein K9K36_07575 [Desulfarculaceae bacterium]|nr:hypothetical protein [Desulfarculaceae bacterium]MCF8122321.1 hypothetical protein [Desulfarculaceae bacterium]
MIELTVRKAVEMLPPGAFLLTHNPASALTDGITGGESLSTGALSTWGHGMTLDHGGMVNSQESRRVRLPLENWEGSILRAWFHCKPKPNLYGRILTALELRLNTRYDWLGIVGQLAGGLVGWLPWVGDSLRGWVSSEIDVPWTNYCTEGECEARRKAGWADFGGNGPCQKSPEDLDNWCIKVMDSEELEEITFKLVPESQGLETSA